MSNIKVVLFDIGNVLMLADHRRTIEGYILRYGVPRELAEQYFKRPDYAETGKGCLSWQEYCDHLRKEWQTPISDSDIFRSDASHIYAVDYGVLSIIDAMMDSGIAVGFVTNTRYPEWERYVVLEPQFNDKFRTWRSDIAHAYKAEPGVPESIIRQWIPKVLDVRVEPHGLFFIDDSENNCTAFAAAGAKAFQYTEREPWKLEKYLREHQLL